MKPFSHNHPSLSAFEKLEGKTIKRCRGFYEEGDEHVSIEFTDGTQLTIVGGSNARSIVPRNKLAELNIDLIFRLK